MTPTLPKSVIQFVRQQFKVQEILFLEHHNSLSSETENQDYETKSNTRVSVA